jgi:hypothetical protein
VIGGVVVGGGACLQMNEYNNDALNAFLKYIFVSAYCIIIT